MLSWSGKNPGIRSESHSETEADVRQTLVSKATTREEEARQLAEQLFGDNAAKCAGFVNRLVNTCALAQDKSFLIIHHPGGWGTNRIEDLLQWERSIVEGVCATMAKMGFQYSLMQHFRTGRGWRATIEDVREQGDFFPDKAKIMAAELEFITRRFENLQVLMIGVSQGAAFSNAVCQNLNGTNKVFSIELGMPFPYQSKRVVTERTLVLDNNGLMPDSLMEWNVPVILKTYLGAPFRWLKYRLQRQKVKFTYCINVPGHDYNWDYPEVQGKIEDFLRTTFGNKSFGGNK